MSHGRFSTNVGFLPPITTVSPINSYMYFKAQCKWSCDFPSALGQNYSFAHLLLTPQRDGRLGLVSSITSELPLDVLNVFLVKKKKKKGKSLPSSNAWPTSSPLSLKAPFVLVYPPAVWVHHVVSTVLGRGRALTMAPLPSSFISQLGILSQVHSSWPLSPLPVRQGWWWLPWLLSALSGFLGGFKQLKAVEAFYEV